MFIERDFKCSSSLLNGTFTIGDVSESFPALKQIIKRRSRPVQRLQNIAVIFLVVYIGQ